MGVGVSVKRKYTIGSVTAQTVNFFGIANFFVYAAWDSRICAIGFLFRGVKQILSLTSANAGKTSFLKIFDTDCLQDNRPLITVYAVELACQRPIKKCVAVFSL
nr:hypothetical protein [Gammaproteobacteria bacterium]